MRAFWQALLAALACLVMARDAAAKDVAGLFIGAFILSGGLVGLVVGLVSPLMQGVKLLRGGLLAVLLSLVAWISWLLYWNFPFPDKTLIGNLPFMVLVLIGTLPVYLVVYGVVWLITRR